MDHYFVQSNLHCSCINMTYLNTSANSENSMLTSLLVPVTGSKTGGMLQISLNGKKYLSLTIRLNLI